MAKILVVDDEISIRRLLAADLMDCGHQVIEASDGEEAFALAVNLGPDVMLVDLNMPGMSGVELLDRLRDLGNKVPMILHSAVEEPEASNLKRLGFSRVVAKPSSFEVILDAINDTLQ